jgi:hypothetical protein
MDGWMDGWIEEGRKRVGERKMTDGDGDGDK